MHGPVLLVNRCAEKDYPCFEIRTEIEETMLPVRRHKNEVARAKRILLPAVLKGAASADDNVQFVLFVRRLQILPFRLVYFDRHIAASEEFNEGFTFADAQSIYRF